MTDVRVSDQEVDVSEQLFEGAQRAREYDEAPEERLVENGAEVVGAEDFELHVESEVITDDSDFVDQQVVVDPNEYQYPVYQEPEPQVQPSVPRAELRAPEKTVGVRATWGKRGVLNRFGFRFRPGQIETAHLDEVRVIRQATWTRPVRNFGG